MKVPQLYKMELDNYKIEMEWIDGTKMKDHLNDKDRKIEEIVEVLEKLGKLVYRVHELGNLFALIL
ncbi:MAG: hypothetical protein V4572_10295 [Bacteroidota bacterium]